MRVSIVYSLFWTLPTKSGQGTSALGGAIDRWIGMIQKSVEHQRDNDVL